MPTKLTIPERVRTNLSLVPPSASSTYKKIERVLTTTPPPGGWRAFTLENISIPISLTSGLLLCLSACAYTRNLSTHLLSCPDWASDCQIRPYITWNAENLALVHGLVTLVYGVGLTLMICGVRRTAESAIWPILTRHPLTFEQIEAFLAVTRGQLFSISPAVRMLRRNQAATFLLLTLSMFVVSLSVAPLVGFVFTLGDVPRQFETTYQVGSGTNQVFKQTIPPSVTDVDAMVMYQSWSKNYTQEPMPEYREWIVDRSVLKEFYSLKAYAMRAIIEIECKGFEIEEYEVLGPDRVRIGTDLGQKVSKGRKIDGGNDSSDFVEVGIPRSGPALTVWVHDFEFLTPNKSRASLVFAEFNGTIEKGRTSKLEGEQLARSVFVSAVMCTVEVELRDELLELGNDTQTQTRAEPEQAIPTLSSTKYVAESSRNDINSPNQNLNELALWLAVSPVLVGPSINGLQPVYVKSTNDIPTTPSSSSPSLLNTTTTPTPPNWPLTTLTNFIHLSLSATTLSTSQTHSPNSNSPHPPLPLSITALTRKLHQSRVIYLLIPLSTVLAIGFVLLCLNIHLHHQHKVPVMRVASLVEVIRSCQGSWLGGLIGEDVRGKGMGELSSLGGVGVMFGVTRGVTRGVGRSGRVGGGNRQGEDGGDDDWDGEMIAGLSCENDIEPFGRDGEIALRRLLLERELDLRGNLREEEV